MTGEQTISSGDEWKQLGKPFQTHIVPGNHTAALGSVTIVAVKLNGSKPPRFKASDRTEILSPEMLRKQPKIPH